MSISILKYIYYLYSLSLSQHSSKLELLGNFAVSYYSASRSILLSLTKVMISFFGISIIVIICVTYFAFNYLLVDRQHLLYPVSLLKSSSSSSGDPSPRINTQSAVWPDRFLVFSRRLSSSLMNFSSGSLTNVSYHNFSGSERTQKEPFKPF